MGKVLKPKLTVSIFVRNQNALCFDCKRPLKEHWDADHLFFELESERPGEEETREFLADRAKREPLKRSVA